VRAVVTFGVELAGKHRFVDANTGEEIEPRWRYGTQEDVYEVVSTTLRRGYTSTSPDDEYEPEHVVFTHRVRLVRS
jgi:hypothetical protein